MFIPSYRTREGIRLGIVYFMISPDWENPRTVVRPADHTAVRGVKKLEGAYAFCFAEFPLEEGQPLIENIPFRSRVSESEMIFLQGSVIDVARIWERANVSRELGSRLELSGCELCVVVRDTMYFAFHSGDQIMHTIEQLKPRYEATLHALAIT